MVEHIHRRVQLYYHRRPIENHIAVLFRNGKIRQGLEMSQLMSPTKNQRKTLRKVHTSNEHLFEAEFMVPVQMHKTFNCWLIDIDIPENTQCDCTQNSKHGWKCYDIFTLWQFLLTSFGGNSCDRIGRATIFCRIDRTFRQLPLHVSHPLDTYSTSLPSDFWNQKIYFAHSSSANGPNTRYCSLPETAKIRYQDQKPKN